MRRRFLYYGCILSLISLVSACGGRNDPVVRLFDDVFEPDIERFDINRSELFPDDELRIDWRANGILDEVRMYLSDDDRISGDDYIFIDENCGTDNNDDFCGGDDRRTYDCTYSMDNSFNCREDRRTIQNNDISRFLDAIPKAGYIILEVCNDDFIDECDSRSLRLTFN